jgi:prophage regulatory protein
MASAAANASLTDNILRVREVCRITGLCRSNLYVLQAQRRFPDRIRISNRAVGWLESEVRQWVQERCTERTARTGPAERGAATRSA